MNAYYWVKGHIKRFCPALDPIERRGNLLGSSDFQRHDVQVEDTGGFLDFNHLQHSIGTVDVGHDSQPTETRNDLAKEFEAFARDICCLKRHTGRIAARAGKAGDDTCANWVGYAREYDRDSRCNLLHRDDCWGRISHNEVGLQPGEFGCKVGEALAVPPCPAILDCDSSTLDPTKFFQSLH